MKANVDIYDSEVEGIFVDESGSDTAEILGWGSDSSVDIQAYMSTELCAIVCKWTIQVYHTAQNI